MPSFLFAVGASRLSTFTHLRAPTMVSCPSVEDYEEYFPLVKAQDRLDPYLCPKAVSWLEETQAPEADSQPCELSTSTPVGSEMTSTPDLATEQAAFAPPTSSTPLVLTGLYRDAFQVLHAPCAHSASAKRFSPTTEALAGRRGLAALCPRASSGSSLRLLSTPATVKPALAYFTPGRANASPASASSSPSSRAAPTSHLPPRPRAKRMPASLERLRSTSGPRRPRPAAGRSPDPAWPSSPFRRPSQSSRLLPAISCRHISAFEGHGCGRRRRVARKGRQRTAASVGEAPEVARRDRRTG